MCSEAFRVYIHIECGSFSVPEHHVCSEAQYYLLKEMTETFPRVKEKRRKKNPEMFYGFQAWYAFKYFSLVELVLEMYWLEMGLIAECDVGRSTWVVGKTS